MPKYRKKPVVVEALEWLGGNREAMANFLNLSPSELNTDDLTHEIIIKTLEGQMRGLPGCFVIKGVKGEFYPCQRDIFFETYEEV